VKIAAPLAAAALLLAGCNRGATRVPPPPEPGPPDEEGTWVAIPAEDLSGDQLEAVQRALAERGFPVEATRAWDDQTRTALRDFQRSRGLPTTGNLNADTAAALGLDPERVIPVRGPPGEIVHPVDGVVERPPPEAVPSGRAGPAAEQPSRDPPAPPDPGAPAEIPGTE
jgi:peptidoglycan hydrolase-like protein with peptidoglycan-binding domain